MNNAPSLAATCAAAFSATPAAIAAQPTAAIATQPHVASTAHSTAPSHADTSNTTWLRLAEYGDWPHPRGLQRFSPAAANAMVRYFKSLRGRLTRKFGGLPVYIGHPDDAHFSGHTGHTDTRAYAWVTDLEARRDGLYGAFRWSTAGEELLRNAFYKFLSPRWAMEPLGKDVFQPVRLLSVGLTNQPNIPGDAIANSTTLPPRSSTQAHPPHGSSCSTTLPPVAPPAHTSGLPTNALAANNTTAPNGASASPNAAAAAPDRSATEPTETAEADEAPITCQRLREALGVGSEIDPMEAIAELREQSERFYRIACEQSDRLSREGASLANARREQIGLVVQNALLSGRIAPHEADSWQQSLEDAPENAHSLLAARPAQLKTTPVANARPADSGSASAASDFLSRVEAHAKEHGLNFAQAWCDLKRRQPHLYSQFFADGR